MPHDRPDTIVGHRLDDAVAWSARDATGEWITIATIPWLKDFCKAVGTSRKIRHHMGRSGFGSRTQGNREFGASTARDWLDPQRGNCSVGRQIFDQTLFKTVQRLGGTLDFNSDSAGVVTHQAGEAFAARQAVDEWTKAYPLNGAG